MKYWKCTVCGYIHEGDAPPDKCPVCGAPASKFKELPGEDGKTAYDDYMAKMGSTLKNVIAKAEQKKKEEADRAAAEKALEAELDAAKDQPPKTPPPLAEKPAAPAPGPTGPGLIFRLLAANHAHPIAVHIPNGIIPMVVFFLLLSTGLTFVDFIATPPGLDYAALYSLIFVVLGMPAVLFTGYVDWKVHYNAARTRVFITKIICGFTLTGLAAALVGWNLLTGGAVARPESPAHWLYILLHLLMLAVAAYAGHLGGMVVFHKD